MTWITDKLSNKELELAALLELGQPVWLPDPDNAPQLMAYLSEATVVGYGGAAGGGKSDLGIGKALNQHSDSMIMRRVGTELQPIIRRILDLRGTRDGFAGGNQNMLTIPERNQTIAFGSVPNLGDETKYQGHPHDFKFYDEATNFLESQVRFLGAWLRNTRVPGQVCEQLLTFNPPQTSEGRWVLDYFGPWLNKQHKNPAAHGELRYFVTIPKGSKPVDFEVPNKPCVIVDGQPVFDFDPAEFDRTRIIHPQSRTFVGSRVTDNKYQNAEYLAQLQSLPEPLRSQMLNGDFYAGIEDSEWQVIPTAWVEAAMARWSPNDRKPAMSSMGVDVARGGKDNSIIARRHGYWYDVPVAYPGAQTPTGNVLAGLIMSNLRDRAPVHIDVVGVGGSPYDFLTQNGIQTIGVNAGATTGIEGYKSQGGMHFANWKSYLWWSMREDLDPTSNTGIALPPDDQLLKDLTAPLWRPRGGKIQMETREEIIKRIGRSPDWGSAYVLARLDTPRLQDLVRKGHHVTGHNPLDFLGGPNSSMGHDPFA